LWKQDFKDALRDINKGNGTEEYQTIVRAYHAILPEMLKIEAEIDIAIAESHIQNPMPRVK
jgi:hypothetical protein